jgi:hypothetical protein
MGGLDGAPAQTEFVLQKRRFGTEKYAAGISQIPTPEPTANAVASVALASICPPRHSTTFLVTEEIRHDPFLAASLRTGTFLVIGCLRPDPSLDGLLCPDPSLSLSFSKTDGIPPAIDALHEICRYTKRSTALTQTLSFRKRWVQ